MNKSVYVIILIFTSLAGYSQTLDSLIKSIERNNPNIQAQERWLEAEKVKSRVGIYPENPAVAYQYLWGNSNEYGDQKELEVIQSFRLPMYYTNKSSMQNLQYDQEVILIEKSRNEILHQARLEYFTLAWLTQRDSLISKRVQQSERLVSLLQSGYDKKEISRPVLDKGRIFHLIARNEWQKIQAEIQMHKENIKQLNGGTLPAIPFYAYPGDWILADLDSLMAQMETRNPGIISARMNMDISEKQVHFEKMNGLPKLEAGYKSETILNQKLKGIHAGISIPLWENKNRVSEAKLGNLWTQSYYNKVETEEKTRLKNIYLNTKMLLDNYSQMKEVIGNSNITESSLSLLEARQISFPEFLTEIQFIYESWENYLISERDYYSALSEIKTFFISDN